jgi:hypothetical protein
VNNLHDENKKCAELNDEGFCVMDFL